MPKIIDTTVQFDHEHVRFNVILRLVHNHTRNVCIDSTGSLCSLLLKLASHLVKTTSRQNRLEYMNRYSRNSET